MSLSKRTKKELLGEVIPGLEQKIADLKQQLEVASSATAGGHRAPLGPSAEAVTHYVRISRTFNYNGHRVGSGLIVQDPSLSLLKAGMGNWEWSHESSWIACRRKAQCIDGQVIAWQGPKQ